MGVLTEDRPKCFTEFKGKPLINWQIEALTTSGVRDIAVVRGYLSEYWDRADVRVSRYFDNPRWVETQMVASLACAEEWLIDDECIVSYSDIFYTAASAKKLLATAADIAITYDPRWLDLWRRRFEDPLSDAETFRIGDTGKLLEIGGKATRVEDIQGQYMGLLKFTPLGWRTVRSYLGSLAKWDRLDMTSMLAGLLRSGADVIATPIDDQWCEIDSARDLAVSSGGRRVK